LCNYSIQLVNSKLINREKLYKMKRKVSQIYSLIIPIIEKMKTAKMIESVGSHSIRPDMAATNERII
jgi:hypothetical protein